LRPGRLRALLEDLPGVLAVDFGDDRPRRQRFLIALRRSHDHNGIVGGREETDTGVVARRPLGRLGLEVTQVHVGVAKATDGVDDEAKEFGIGAAGLGGRRQVRLGRRPIRPDALQVEVRVGRVDLGDEGGHVGLVLGGGRPGGRQHRARTQKPRHGGEGHA
jgi:hypothetical protein